MIINMLYCMLIFNISFINNCLAMSCKHCQTVWERDKCAACNTCRKSFIYIPEHTTILVFWHKKVNIQTQNRREEKENEKNLVDLLAFMIE